MICIALHECGWSCRFYLSFRSDRFTQTSPMIRRRKSVFGRLGNVDWISFSPSFTCITSKVALRFPFLEREGERERERERERISHGPPL